MSNKASAPEAAKPAAAARLGLYVTIKVVRANAASILRYFSQTSHLG